MNNKISSIYEDNEKSLWVGTYRSGMFQLTDRKFLRYNKKNGLPVNITRSIYRGADGTTWIGTVGGGLVRYKDGKFKTYNEAEGLLNNGVWSIDSSKDGTLWFGTYGGGLHRLKDGKIKAFKTSQSSSKDIVRAVFVDSKENVWAGTDGGGVDVFGADGFIRNYNKKNGLSDNYIYSLNEDRDGTIWVGTFNGGINLIKRDGTIDILDKNDGLPQNAVWVMYQDAGGEIWIGTNDGGLVRYTDGTFFTYTKKHGLFSDTAFQILESGGFLWMNCNGGMYKVARRELDDFKAGKIKKLNCIFFGRDDGFKDVEGTGPAQPAGFVDDNGKIWFPTLKGVIVITADGHAVNRIPPPVMVEKVTINDREYNPEKLIAVPPGKGDAQLDYAGLSYLLPGKIRFKYKLQGYNNDWIDAGSRRTAFYTNLSPGDYTFKVKACNSDGVWNEEGSSFSFVLQPHFYETLWFYFAVFLLFCFFVYQGIRLRERRHKQKARELRRLVAEQTRELRAANMRLAELSSLDGLTEIHNRRLFEEYLEKEWRRCQRNKLPISLLMVDVDSFKLYNDTYGHQKGDMALKSVAIILAHSISRSGDMAARYGGEEFAVILGETTAEGALTIAEKLRARVEVLEIPHSNSNVSDHLTISVGCATAFPEEGKAPDSLVRAADLALYKAKDSGRNRVSVLNLM